MIACLIIHHRKARHVYQSWRPRVNTTSWQVSPVLGVRRVRHTAEYYRDKLGFTLDPVDGVFQPVPAEPDGVYAIVKRFGVWIHFQIRRDDPLEQSRAAFERDVYIYVDDVDSLHAELERRGAVILSPPAMAPHGIREMVVEDLNEFRIAFGQLQRNLTA